MEIRNESNHWLPNHYLYRGYCHCCNELGQMSLHFRHYKDKNLTGQRDFRLGWVAYDKRQPTLDFLFGTHVFVVFWKRRGQ